MSGEQNVARLRAMYEAFSREDFDAAVEIAHPEVEFTRLGEGTIRGADAIRAWMEPDALQAHRVEPVEFRTNANKVVVRQHHKARGAESGIAVEAEAWVVFTFDDDGRVIHVEGFLDRQDQALDAAGLTQ